MTSIDGRLKRLETKAEDCDATTNTTFVKEGIVDDTDDTILNSNIQDLPGNDGNQDIEEIIMVPTSHRFEVLPKDNIIKVYDLYIEKDCRSSLNESVP